MKKLFIFYIVFLATSAAAFDLKGLELGKPATNAQIKAATGIDCSDFCSGFTQLAGQEFRVTIGRDAQLNVTHIYSEFDNVFFETLDDALTAKFGKPSEAKTLANNAFGAQFEQIFHQWTSNGQVIALMKYSTASRGMLDMVSAEEAARRAGKAKKSANDI